ncbi:hypothetical protein CQB49_19860 [Salmonella enterica]|nr:hypothetical protein EAE34_24025 [Salmonella enterica subsp. enterica serovar Anatum]EAM2147486.1 hypothetical protein [Salmonella enterica]EBV6529636.1 hypothetical protein [Salmonella enterica subsp. enterica serovar Oranienburg]ECT6469443.1 hypothetical protein [Salmonella enterica subsp. enterica serovar Senegal]MIF28778.1 hypothetical protein [Salmonella enterica subsp. enterica serovar Rubislaw]
MLLRQQKVAISLSPPDFCNSAILTTRKGCLITNFATVPKIIPGWNLILITGTLFMVAVLTLRESNILSDLQYHIDQPKSR